ncbi:putative U4/U6 small nuclear ribonucleoprotein Prp31 [Helianthus annuus]|nr:putative U4/U6 small nuclear ribonucleoprotein Prp31 [Helianthus annuus]
MLDQVGNRKLRVSVSQSKLATKVAKKLKDKQHSSGGATSRLTSNYAFTPVQVGIDQLIDPQADANTLGSGTRSTYFSETRKGTFSKIKRTRAPFH